MPPKFVKKWCPLYHITITGFLSWSRIAPIIIVMI
jgi:hypothetical protein